MTRLMLRQAGSEMSRLAKGSYVIEVISSQPYMLTEDSSTVHTSDSAYALGVAHLTGTCDFVFAIGEQVSYDDFADGEEANVTARIMSHD